MAGIVPIPLPWAVVRLSSDSRDIGMLVGLSEHIAPDHGALAGKFDDRCVV